MFNKFSDRFRTSVNRARSSSNVAARQSGHGVPDAEAQQVEAQSALLRSSSFPVLPPEDVTVGLDELPVYLAPQSAAGSEHIFALKRRNTPWLTLKLRSSAGTSSARPLYFDGAAVEGTVELVLTNAEAIQSVFIVFEGQTCASGLKAVNFLTLSSTLWSPRSSAASRTEKLKKGSYLWPFALSLPRTAPVRPSSQQNLQLNQEGDVLHAPLPPTYSANGFPASLDYSVKVVVSRGALRPDSILTTSVVFVPRSRPKPPSRLRQFAYTNRTPLPGPEDDSESWTSLSFIIRGTFFAKLDVEVNCIFSIAKPLVYARNTSIPFLVTFESQATQALDLFNSPFLVKATLERIDSLRSEELFATDHTNSVDSDLQGVALPHPLQDDFRKVISVGICTPSRNQSAPEWRRLQGEISVPKDVKPTFSFPPFKLNYTVTLIIDAVGFVPEGKSSHAAMFSQDVIIVTDRPRGPRHASNFTTPVRSA